MREIPLPNGMVTLVDDDMFDLLSAHRWSLARGYARRGSEHDGRHRIHYMHRIVVGAVAGQLVDHIDSNKLHNTRANLRLCNSSQNMANRQLTRVKASGPYKGVILSRHIKNPFVARIKVNYRTIYLGVFATDIDAARAYDAAAVEHFGEFARLNFPVIKQA